MEEPSIYFGQVIFGEQKTCHLTVKNSGALSTKIYVKTNEGRTIPFFNMDDLRHREDQQRLYKEFQAEKERIEEEKERKRQEKLKEQEENEDKEAAAEEQQPEEEEEEKIQEPEELLKVARMSEDEVTFEEFLA